MSLSDFNVAKHPSEFDPIKYLPYEILKIERKTATDSQVFGRQFDSVLSGFEEVEAEEINEDEKILVSRIVDELTSVRSREVRPQIIGNEAQILKVGK